MRRHALLFACLAFAAPSYSARGADPAQDTAAVSLDLDVISRRLDVARQQIQPSLGASVYDFTPQALEIIPRGAERPAHEVLLRAPGVAQDSFGQIHLRGEHANVQYRLNGVELPEGLSVFGQALISRFANSISLITGALPAQYGFQTAGVVDIQTKTGITNPGFVVSMYGGQQIVDAAQLRVWRPRRAGGLVHHRRLPAQQCRHRESNVQLQRDPRHHEPVPRPRLCLGHHRSRNQGQHDPGRLRRPVPNSQQSRPVHAGLRGERRLPTSTAPTSTRTSASAPTSPSCRCRSMSATSTCRSPPTPATAGCITRPTGWAICCSTASRSKRGVPTPPMAYSRTEAGASTISTRCASAFRCSRQ